MDRHSTNGVPSEQDASAVVNLSQRPLERQLRRFKTVLLEPCSRDV